MKARPELGGGDELRLVLAQQLVEYALDVSPAGDVGGGPMGRVE